MKKILLAITVAFTGTPSYAALPAGASCDWDVSTYGPEEGPTVRYCVTPDNNVWRCELRPRVGYICISQNDAGMCPAAGPSWGC